MKVGTIIKSGLAGIAGLTLLMTSFGAFEVVPEGHVGIVKQFGKATEQVDAGLNFKIPFIQKIEELEVRQRRNVETLQSSTSGQMSINAKVSINWTVNKSSALEIYVKYGGLDQFEERILDPKLRSVAKAALAKFSAEDLIKDRNRAVAEIQLMMTETMQGFPIQIDSPQIENIELPEQYLQAVEDKMTAKEAANKAKFDLEKQKTEARRAVNTAEAERDSEKARADGQAYRMLKEAEAEAKAIKAIGTAEAEAIRQMADAIRQNPNVIEYQKAKTWDGKMPQTVLGTGTNVIMGLK